MDCDFTCAIEFCNTQGKHQVIAFTAVLLGGKVNFSGVILYTIDSFVVATFTVSSTNVTYDGLLVYVCLDTCCSLFLTIIAGVGDLHFRHESGLPVCRTRGLNLGRRSARRGC